MTNQSPSMPAPPSSRDQADGPGAREQIRDVKDRVVGQAKSSLQQARDRATSSLNESRSQFADQIGTVADALRRTTEHLRSEDQARIAGFTDTLARRAEDAAGYLRDADTQRMRNDLEEFARRRPALVLGGALAIGVLGARFLKSSRSSENSAPARRDYARIGAPDAGYGRDRDDTFGTPGLAGSGPGSQFPGAGPGMTGGVHARG